MRRAATSFPKPCDSDKRESTDIVTKMKNAENAELILYPSVLDAPMMPEKIRSVIGDHRKSESRYSKYAFPNMTSLRKFEKQFDIGLHLEKSLGNRVVIMSPLLGLRYAYRHHHVKGPRTSARSCRGRVFILQINKEQQNTETIKTSR